MELTQAAHRLRLVMSAPGAGALHRPLSLPRNPSMCYGQPISWQAQSGENRSQEHQEMGTELEDN